MILNTGQRTDIPAYYSEWFYNRVSDGYVMVRNPFNHHQVTKYILSPDVVDIICFCTKNPTPMLARINEINNFNQFWFVTITPYDQSIEPNVPNKRSVINSFKQLSKIVGVNCVSWRYDPILIDSKYTIEFHLKSFEAMCKKLCGYTKTCTISYIDLYQKTRRNFPTARGVTDEEQILLTKELVKIANKYNIELYGCSEDSKLSQYGLNVSGCMNQNVIETALGYKINVPNKNYQTRKTCSCLLGSDIGSYNTCLHACKYCYANYDMEEVYQSNKLHDVDSPLLIGNLEAKDRITESEQILYKQNQLSLF